MNYQDTIQISLAHAIAIVAHRGQRYGEHPYIFHLNGVVANLVASGKLEPDLYRADAYAIAAGWLHDVLEDTDLNAGHLLDAGIDPAVVGLVAMLTRVKGEAYADYIERLIDGSDEHPALLMIKLADLDFNLANNPRPSLILRYKLARNRIIRQMNWLTV